MTTASWIWVGVLLIGIVLLVLYMRTGRFFRCLLFTAFTGVGALGILWIVGRFVAVPITVTPLSVAVSALLGVPGVVAMLIINLI